MAYRWLVLCLFLICIPCPFIPQASEISGSDKISLSETAKDIAHNSSTFSYESKIWVESKSSLLQRYFDSSSQMVSFLEIVYYESNRAGLDPNLVLDLIKTESNFRKYSISSANARGYMQVMPFWLKEMGHPSDNLFDTKTNIRYGCTILRHYIDNEKGNLFFALGSYNGSRGSVIYPMQILLSWNTIAQKEQNMRIARN